MQKINVVTDGDYKGHLVVFSQGCLWINTGVLGLKRMDSKALRDAKVTDAHKRVISVTFNDGARCSILMGPKLFIAALDSLAPFFTQEESIRARQAVKSTKVEGEENRGQWKKGNQKPQTQNVRRAPLPAIILAISGVVLLVLLKLLGKI